MDSEYTEPVKPVPASVGKALYGKANLFVRDSKSSDAGKVWLDTKINFLNEVMKYMPRTVTDKLTEHSEGKNNVEVGKYSKAKNMYADSIYNSKIYTADLWKGAQGKAQDNLYNGSNEGKIILADGSALSASRFAGLLGIPTDMVISLGAFDGSNIIAKDLTFSIFNLDETEVPNSSGQKVTVPGHKVAKLVITSPKGTESCYLDDSTDASGASMLYQRLIPIISGIAGSNEAKVFREGVNFHPTVVDMQNSTLTFNGLAKDFLVDMDGDGFADNDLDRDGTLTSSEAQKKINLTNTTLAVSQYQNDYLDKLGIYSPIVDYSAVYQSFMQGSMFNFNTTADNSVSLGDKDELRYNNLVEALNGSAYQKDTTSDFKIFVEKIKKKMPLMVDGTTKDFDYMPNIYEIARSGIDLADPALKFSDKEVFFLSMLMLESRRRYTEGMATIFGVNNKELDLSDIIDKYANTDNWNNYDKKTKLLYMDAITGKDVKTKKTEKMYNYMIPEDVGSNINSTDAQYTSKMIVAKTNWLKRRAIEAEGYRTATTLYQDQVVNLLNKTQPFYEELVGYTADGTFFSKLDTDGALETGFAKDFQQEYKDFLAFSKIINNVENQDRIDSTVLNNYFTLGSDLRKRLHYVLAQHDLVKGLNSTAVTDYASYKDENVFYSLDSTKMNGTDEFIRNITGMLGIMEEDVAKVLNEANTVFSQKVSINGTSQSFLEYALANNTTINNIDLQEGNTYDNLETKPAIIKRLSDVLSGLAGVQEKQGKVVEAAVAVARGGKAITDYQTYEEYLQKNVLGVSFNGNNTLAALDYLFEKQSATFYDIKSLDAYNALNYGEVNYIKDGTSYKFLNCNLGYYPDSVAKTTMATNYLVKNDKTVGENGTANDVVFGSNDVRQIDRMYFQMTQSIQKMSTFYMMQMFSSPQYGLDSTGGFKDANEDGTADINDVTFNFLSPLEEANQYNTLKTRNGTAEINPRLFTKTLGDLNDPDIVVLKDLFAYFDARTVSKGNPHETKYNLINDDGANGTKQISIMDMFLDTLSAKKSTNGSAVIFDLVDDYLKLIDAIDDGSKDMEDFVEFTRTKLFGANGTSDHGILKEIDNSMDSTALTEYMNATGANFTKAQDWLIENESYAWYAASVTTDLNSTAITTDQSGLVIARLNVMVEYEKNKNLLPEWKTVGSRNMDKKDYDNYWMRFYDSMRFLAGGVDISSRVTKVWSGMPNALFQDRWQDPDTKKYTNIMLGGDVNSNNTSDVSNYSGNYGKKVDEFKQIAEESVNKDYKALRTFFTSFYKRMSNLKFGATPPAVGAIPNLNDYFVNFNSSSVGAYDMYDLNGSQLTRTNVIAEDTLCPATVAFNSTDSKKKIFELLLKEGFIVKSGSICKTKKHLDKESFPDFLDGTALLSNANINTIIDNFTTVHLSTFKKLVDDSSGVSINGLFGSTNYKLSLDIKSRVKNLLLSDDFTNTLDELSDLQSMLKGGTKIAVQNRIMLNNGTQSLVQSYNGSLEESILHLGNETLNSTNTYSGQKLLFDLSDKWDISKDDYFNSTSATGYNKDASVTSFFKELMNSIKDADKHLKIGSSYSMDTILNEFVKGANGSSFAKYLYQYMDGVTDLSDTQVKKDLETLAIKQYGADMDAFTGGAGSFFKKAQGAYAAYVSKAITAAMAAAAAQDAINQANENALAAKEKRTPIKVAPCSVTTPEHRFEVDITNLNGIKDLMGSKIPGFHTVSNGATVTYATNNINYYIPSFTVKADGSTSPPPPTISFKNDEASTWMKTGEHSQELKTNWTIGKLLAKDTDNDGSTDYSNGSAAVTSSEPGINTSVKFNGMATADTFHRRSLRDEFIRDFICYKYGDFFKAPQDGTVGYLKAVEDIRKTYNSTANRELYAGIVPYKNATDYELPGANTNGTTSELAYQPSIYDTIIASSSATMSTKGSVGSVETRMETLITKYNNYRLKIQNMLGIGYDGTASAYTATKLNDDFRKSYLDEFYMKDNFTPLINNSEFDKRYGASQSLINQYKGKPDNSYLENNTVAAKGWYQSYGKYIVGGKTADSIYNKSMSFSNLDYSVTDDLTRQKEAWSTAGKASSSSAKSARSARQIKIEDFYGRLSVEQDATNEAIRSTFSTTKSNVLGNTHRAKVYKNDFNIVPGVADTYDGTLSKLDKVWDLLTADKIFKNKITTSEFQEYLVHRDIYDKANSEPWAIIQKLLKHPQPANPWIEAIDLDSSTEFYFKKSGDGGPNGTADIASWVDILVALNGTKYPEYVQKDIEDVLFALYSNNSTADDDAKTSLTKSSFSGKLIDKALSSTIYQYLLDGSAFDKEGEMLVTEADLSNTSSTIRQYIDKFKYTGGTVSKASIFPAYADGTAIYSTDLNQIFVNLTDDPLAIKILPDDLTALTVIPQALKDMLKQPCYIAQYKTDMEASMKTTMTDMLVKAITNPLTLISLNEFDGTVDASNNDYFGAQGELTNEEDFPDFKDFLATVKARGSIDSTKISDEMLYNIYRIISDPAYSAERVGANVQMIHENNEMVAYGNELSLAGIKTSGYNDNNNDNYNREKNLYDENVRKEQDQKWAESAMDSAAQKRKSFLASLRRKKG